MCYLIIFRDWYKCPCVCARLHDTLLVRLSLGNKVVFDVSEADSKGPPKKFPPAMSPELFVPRIAERVQEGSAMMQPNEC